MYYTELEITRNTRKETMTPVLKTFKSIREPFFDLQEEFTKEEIELLSFWGVAVTYGWKYLEDIFPEEIYGKKKQLKLLAPKAKETLGINIKGIAKTTKNLMAALYLEAFVNAFNEGRIHGNKEAMATLRVELTEPLKAIQEVLELPF